MRVLRLLGAAVDAGKRCSATACATLIRAASLVPRSLSLQTLLIGLNAWLFVAGVRAWRRARFAAAVRLVTQLDEEGLQFVLKNLPAWVKFSDYERAKFLNDALGMLWPAFDTALCNLIRAELEPFMRECAPAMVQGLYFERLSFGLARPSILGVRSVPSWNAEHLAIELDVDLRWAGEPDIVLKLEPTNKWVTNALRLGKLKVLPAVDITPTMTCRVRMIQVSAILRVSLAPVLPDLPFVGAVSLSLMTPPYLDFDLRLSDGPDIMSVPALSSYLQESLSQVFLSAMTWPNVVRIDILNQPEQEEDVAPPLGILSVQARTPRTLLRL